jgi:hypothetical protein
MAFREDFQDVPKEVLVYEQQIVYPNYTNPNLTTVVPYQTMPPVQLMPVDQQDSSNNGIEYGCVWLVILIILAGLFVYYFLDKKSLWGTKSGFAERTPLSSLVFPVRYPSYQ